MIALSLIAWAALLLSTVTAQGLEYHFTMGVTSPAPVPGKPFTFTWTGGESTEDVYIVLNGYFPDTPNQNILYMTTDILCKLLPAFPRCLTDALQQTLLTTGPGHITCL